jgi:hypothetical protein
MHTTATTSPGSEFHEFLYAPIGNDADGMTLSVLSALARQDLDPWAEARRLAQLPQRNAVEQILGLLDALPPRIVGGLNRVEVAGRLSALLPRQAGPSAGVNPRPPTGARDPAGAIGFNWRFLCFYFCLMLLMNWLMAISRAPPPPPAAAPAPTGTISPPPEGGQ